MKTKEIELLGLEAEFKTLHSACPQQEYRSIIIKMMLKNIAVEIDQLCDTLDIGYPIDIRVAMSCYL